MTQMQKLPSLLKFDSVGRLPIGLGRTIYARNLRVEFKDFSLSVVFL